MPLKPPIDLTFPIVNKDILTPLRAGDRIRLSGTIYTARDAAHKRFMKLFEKGRPLPINLENQALYYCGPTPPTKTSVTGSAGPTTSSRMDVYTPDILRKTGLAAMIGKGGRGPAVIEAIKECGAIYMAAVGGAGALISSRIKSSQIICYEELGTEAVHKFETESLPLIVAIDSKGNDLYELGPKEYLWS
ncbi:MAG: FumA C-terminus/TtdB family hydratase beta subunit [Chitinispirillales bacterium]|jgi:fumarate hydratase subunit beta|nr:FumA C-terminus/TtdB family hydratase beta subunit [Chitinispirillales bacterium]